eukprot:CAMPEP_0202894946 /NCGR_PEP_ID=MMETSP1392-20130828/4235_1 /ASSEMBLY_ACC=CAM_ASM_000868 /TAXON_ID=225041 /ORGANISM="Chlamydomonas chlamydogama, Strain SAG 11-48b" /LENGTH=173 /DNA_ID=CAMNT_0049579801 /DNA_START=392 /DNA_END=913 /DNA_ORIENTATION=-
MLGIQGLASRFLGYKQPVSVADSKHTLLPYMQQLLKCLCGGVLGMSLYLGVLFLSKFPAFATAAHVLLPPHTPPNTSPIQILASMGKYIGLCTLLTVDHIKQMLIWGFFAFQTSLHACTVPPLELFLRQPAVDGGWLRSIGFRRGKLKQSNGVTVAGSTCSLVVRRGFRHCMT